MYRSPLDALAAELGDVAGQIERESALRISAAIADLQRHEAERELRYEKLERQILERLATLKDGAPGERGPEGPRGERGDAGPVGQTGADGIQGLPGQDGRDGKDGAPGKDGAAGADGAPGLDGKDGAPGVAGEPGKDGARGEPGAPGQLPIVRAWADRVHYEGDVVTHLGSLWQAARDTAKHPPFEDWICLASAGKDGSDGRSFAIRGTFKDGDNYEAMDVVSLNGASFAAKRDNPGPCPGDGWQLIARQGSTGKPGDRGASGARGEAGPAGPGVIALDVNHEGLVTLTNEDGSQVSCDLYPVLVRLK